MVYENKCCTLLYYYFLAHFAWLKKQFNYIISVAYIVKTKKWVVGYAIPVECICMLKNNAIKFLCFPFVLNMSKLVNI